MHSSKFGLVGMGPDTVDKVAVGDPKALMTALLCLAGHWMEQGGMPRFSRSFVAMTDALPKDSDRFAQRPAEQRALLAAGCDLHDLLTHSPQGRQALEDLLAKPIAHHPKGKG
jgi:hypothetical protein